MQELFNHLQGHYKLDTEILDILNDSFEEVVCSKNDFLLQSSQVCRHLYFIKHGAVRGYYILEDKEITHWFGFENDFVTSFHSFITGQAAVENLQLMEGSILWKISKEKLDQLYNRYHAIERLVRIIYEKYYIRLEERFVNAQFKTAAERYESLVLQSPHIIERVPLGYIASYLGISQETLSRIRNRF